jgi:hypothetical protein
MALTAGQTDVAKKPSSRKRLRWKTDRVVSSLVGGGSYINAFKNYHVERQKRPIL